MGIGQWIRKQLIVLIVMMILDSYQRLKDPYSLDLTNTVSIQAKLPHLCPKEEAWLDIHLDELVAKGVIGPIFLGE